MSARFDYQEFVDLAKELIYEFGMPVTIVRSDGVPVYDPIEDTTTGGAEVRTEVNAVLVTADQEYTDKMGDVFQAGDQMCLMEPGYAPAMGDVLEFIDGNWTIMNIERLAPAGRDILYTLLVRR